jgi:hypothetical protein
VRIAYFIESSCAGFAPRWNYGTVYILHQLGIVVKFCSNNVPPCPQIKSGQVHLAASIEPLFYRSYLSPEWVRSELFDFFRKTKKIPLYKDALFVFRLRSASVGENNIPMAELQGNTPIWILVYISRGRRIEFNCEMKRAYGVGRARYDNDADLLSFVHREQMCDEPAEESTMGNDELIASWH